MKGKFSCVPMCFLLISFTTFTAAELELFSNIFNKNNLYYPTIHAESEKCRNFSLSYLKNLRNGVLWANEIYDATAKLQSGILHGSTYNLGNFDQCVEVKVPLNNIDEMSGKYCMVKFTLRLWKKTNATDHQYRINFEEDDYRKYYNVTVRKKILEYSKLQLRFPRHEVYTAFCIPSVCTREDLEFSLRQIILNNTDIKVDVGERSCQIKEDFFQIDISDITFALFIIISGLIILCASAYHLVTKLEGFEKYKFERKQDSIIRCFSFPANLRKLLKISKTSDGDGLDSIAGLKVFSMFLIIMGHRCMFDIGSPVLNARYVEQIYRTPDATVLLNGPIIVDTFFIISGFLSAFILLDKLKDTKNVLSRLPLIYFHRIVRILPVYAVVVAFYCTLFVKMGSGPFWYERVVLEQERCKENWWANILFINNYINIDRICMFQSWFIDCDIHFFIITPILVWLLLKNAAAGVSTVAGLIAGSTFLVFGIVYINNYDPILLLYMKLLKDPVLNTTFQKVYIPSHMRATPYLIGILLGYLRYEIKISGYKVPRYIVYWCWPISVVVAIATIYVAFIFYIPDTPQNDVFAAFYAGVHHLTWSLCIGWVIIALTTGNGPWIERLLGWKPLICLSRITYPAFLIHGAIQIYTAATMRAPTYASIFTLIYQTSADIALSYTLGCFLSLLYEAPIMQLEKVIFEKGNYKDKNLRKMQDTNQKELEFKGVAICELKS